MNNHLIFAVSRLDAEAACETLDIKFEETIWVMNYQLLGDLDISGKNVFVTPSFMETPAYQEVVAKLEIEDDE